MQKLQAIDRYWKIENEEGMPYEKNQRSRIDRGGMRLVVHECAVKIHAKTVAETNEIQRSQRCDTHTWDT